MLLAGTNIQVRNPKVFSESSHSDRETDVAWKTSHWSSTLEAALHESDPCFSSLSIPHSSLASTSLLRFKDQDTAFDIQLKFRGSSCLPLDTCAFHCEKLWSVSQTYLQIIPSDFQSSFCLFYEGGLPFSLNSDSFLSASTPRPPFLPSCRHSSTQFSLLFVRVSQDWATVGAWVNLKTAVLIRWRTETLCSVNNFIKASHRRRLWIFAKKMWRNSKLSTQRHTRSPSTYLGAYLLLTHSFTCSRFFIEWAESPHKGRKLSVTLNKKKKSNELLLLSINPGEHGEMNVWIKGKISFW